METNLGDLIGQSSAVCLRCDYNQGQLARIEMEERSSLIDHRFDDIERTESLRQSRSDC